MAQPDYKFAGWIGLAPETADGKMVWQEFEPKEWEETDIDIKVTHCGICGSDLHTLRSGWGPTKYPCCVGHEIIGIAVRVGSKAVGDIKVGNRFGVVGTYNGIHLHGGKSYGGYSLYNRTPSNFVIKIPDAIPSADAAPMLCGGVTVYSPLKHNGCGPGKRVGIIGVGGLGHFGVLFTKALGADKVVAISRKASKSADSLQMGADTYIATEDEPDWATKYARSLDLIVCTVSSSKMPMTEYLGLHATNGSLVQAGLPEDGSLFANVRNLILRVKVDSSFIGSPNEIREMLYLVAEKG
ncbi:chaperonin 10-like protein [Aspergillus alliaceus]|uniref:alcohol dehydrogenase (NADP(+)) n=1 Tax=Petromyces alliaceus TaxID=209559 RepID=A0A5N7BX22_PETAA|nr:chaperonin 10-like protein [Aspergillus alliaceus]